MVSLTKKSPNLEFQFQAKNASAGNIRILSILEGLASAAAVPVAQESTAQVPGIQRHRVQHSLMHRLHGKCTLLIRSAIVRRSSIDGEQDNNRIQYGHQGGDSILLRPKLGPIFGPIF